MTLESPSVSILPSERRRYDLDALRGFAMLLGIGLHASLAFFPAAWWVQDRTSGLEGLFDEFLWAVHGFRMPAFFLMSGFFTALLWRRRGLGALLNHRLRRVALPLLIGLFTIIPLTTIAGDWAAESAPAPRIADDDIWGKVFAGDVAGVEQLLDRGFDADLRGEPGG
jgi:peptidoglycan/LPS O-acetylase OafA/YrhL